ncbi:MAG: tetratricopeptide repeat protein [Gemmatimonadota bacterium]|jgi:serine/threonine-protein kinase
MTRATRAYQLFFAELKRRRVFKSAAVYGGVAFVVIQAADFMVPALRLPESVSTVIAVLAIVGFPISMVLTWTFDITAEGMRVTGPSSPGELAAIAAQPRLKRWPVGIGAVVGFTLLIGGVSLELGEKILTDGSIFLSSGPNIESIAVMPFLTVGGNSAGDGVSRADGDYLGEGIANELLEALSRVPNLHVTARSSAFSLRGSAYDPESASRQLQVASLLEGSVDSSSDGVELALRLLPAGAADPIWTGSFVLTKEGFLNELDDVAWAVAGALGVMAPEEDRERLVPPHTESFAAYSDYLKGRHLSRLGTPDALLAAIEDYHRAVLLDPDFPSAWAALSTAYVLLPEYGGPPIAEVLPYAEAALERAMAPGREMAEGYAASAYLKWAYLWDLPGAEKDFRRSIEIDPRNPTSRYWYAELLATERRWEGALEEATSALELDPRSAPAHMTLGLVLMCSGREGAADAFRKALELAPEMHPVAYLLGEHLAMTGNVDEAGAAFDRFAELTGADPSVYRAYLAAVSDPSQRSQALTALQEPAFFGPVQRAALLAHLGDYDASLTLLEEAVRSRSPYLPWANAMPEFQGMRSDSRFQSILAWVRF